MHKILATLIAGLFAAGAYAQTPAPAAPVMPAAATVPAATPAPAAMPAPAAKAAKTTQAKSQHKKVVKKKAHKPTHKAA